MCLPRPCFQRCPESLASLRASARIAFVKDSAGAVRCKFGQEALWVADSLLAKDIQNGLEATSPTEDWCPQNMPNFFNQDWLISWHRFVSPVFFGSPGSTSLYRCASSPTSRDGRHLHPQSFYQQPSSTPTRQKIRFARELLPKFLLLQCIPASFQHIKCQNGGSKQRLHANNGQVLGKRHAGWSYRIPRNPQQTIWDGTFKYEKSYFVETLMSLSQILGAKTPRGHTISMSYTVLQCLWLLMEYRFLGDLRMLKDWPCKWFKCPIEIHRKLTVAKEKMNKHWLKIFVNKWYVALFTFIYTYTYTVIYIAVYIAYPNILLVRTQGWSKTWIKVIDRGNTKKTKPSELPTWRISASRARHSFMTHPLLRTILKAHEGPGLDQKKTQKFEADDLVAKVQEAYTYPP